MKSQPMTVYYIINADADHNNLDVDKSVTEYIRNSLSHAAPGDSFVFQNDQDKPILPEFRHFRQDITHPTITCFDYRLATDAILDMQQLYGRFAAINVYGFRARTDITLALERLAPRVFDAPIRIYYAGISPNMHPKSFMALMKFQNVIIYE